VTLDHTSVWQRQTLIRSGRPIYVGVRKSARPLVIAMASIIAKKPHRLPRPGNHGAPTDPGRFPKTQHIRPF
jgi:hypothetical protein